MNNIHITGNVPLSNLTPISANTYNLVVKFYTSSGVLLADSRIPNPYTATFTSTTPAYAIDVPIDDDTYDLENITIKVFANDDDDCCVGTVVADLGGTSGEVTDPALVGLTGAAYRYDATSHDFTLTLASDSDLQVNAQPGSGIFQDGSPWNSITYNNGAKTFVDAGFRQRFSFNPSVSGTGGVVPSTTVVFRVRRLSDPSKIYLLTFDVPATSATNLTTIPLSSTPPPGDCARNPTVSTILDQGPTFVRARFDADGVTEMTYRVYESTGSTVLRTGSSGTVTSNDLTVTFAALADGNYLYSLQGASCDGPESPKKPFTIATGGGTPPTQEGIANGLITVAVGGRYFDLVASENARPEVLSTGRVRLILPAEKPSQNGSSTTRPIIMGSNMQDLPAGLRSELLSATGAFFPTDKAETFFIIYMRPDKGTTIDGIESDIWKVIGDPATAPDYFGGYERCSVYCYIP